MTPTHLSSSYLVRCAKAYVTQQSINEYPGKWWWWQCSFRQANVKIHRIMRKKSDNNYVLHTVCCHDRCYCNTYCHYYGCNNNNNILSMVILQYYYYYLIVFVQQDNHGSHSLFFARTHYVLDGKCIHGLRTTDIMGSPCKKYTFAIIHEYYYYYYYYSWNNNECHYYYYYYFVTTMTIHNYFLQYYYYS